MDGTVAPDFSLPDQDGVIHNLRDYAGRWLVLYFYPNDDSINCTREACNFRDEYRVISQFGNAQVIGVNKAPIASHKKFADKYKLNFPLLSDPGHKVTSTYGSWRSSNVPLYDRPFGTRRNTFLINPEGYVVKSFLGVDPDNHAQEVIQTLQDMQAVSRA